VVVHDFAEPGHEGIHGSVAGDTGRVGQELLAPDEARALAEVDHALEEAAEDGETEALAEAGETGGVRQRLVQAVAEIPADAQAIRGQRQELTLRADALEDHHQGALEADDGIDGRPAPARVGVADPFPNEAEVEPGFEVAGAVAVRDEPVEGHGDGPAEVAGLGGTEHGRSPQPPGAGCGPPQARAA